MNEKLAGPAALAQRRRQQPPTAYPAARPRVAGSGVGSRALAAALLYAGSAAARRKGD